MQAEKKFEMAVQTKAEVSELVGLTSEIRRQLNILTEETATVKEVSMEVKLMRGEMQQAREAVDALSARVETAASKLTFLDSPGERPLFIDN